MTVFVIGMQLWFRRRIVNEFPYDGRALRFRTLGRGWGESLSAIRRVEFRGGRGADAPRSWDAGRILKANSLIVVTSKVEADNGRKGRLCFETCASASE